MLSVQRMQTSEESLPGMPHCPASVATSCQLGSRLPRRAGEGPHIGDVGHRLGASIDDGAGGIAGRGDQLGQEAHHDLGRLALKLGSGHLGLVDGHEGGFHRLAPALALGDRPLEALIDLLGEGDP